MPKKDVVEDPTNKTPNIWTLFVDGSIAQEKYRCEMILSGFSKNTFYIQSHK